MSKNILEDRIERLRKKMAESQVDTVMICSDENREYLSGYTGKDGSYDESAGILVVTSDELILACDPRFDRQAEQEAPLYSVVCYKKRLSQELPGILESVGARKVGVEDARMTVKNFNEITRELQQRDSGVELLPCNGLFKDLRLRKDDTEVALIRKALKIAETSFLQFRETIQEGQTEKQAAWTLEKLMRENGAQSLSFDVIAASGSQSALPHAIPGEKTFEPGEPLLFDFGAKVDGYCSDTTRTLIMGHTEPRFEDVFHTVFEAQKKAVEAIRPGIKASDVDAVAREYIDSTKFEGKFGHSLGHGVGIAIHEAPRLSRLDETILETGMVVTVEPGIYIPEWGGIRLENMILVTEDGAEVLNETGYGNYLIQ
ncbi:MAG: aminopeptidase P family protein [Desulfarculaceae bacterium]|nr:aminopeptidase P family protein [Desulfarculaceae bacterium]